MRLRNQAAHSWRKISVGFSLAITWKARCGRGVGGQTRMRVRGDFYANGYFSQRIYIGPDRQLVIVRLGLDGSTAEGRDVLAGIADRWP